MYKRAKNEVLSSLGGVANRDRRCVQIAACRMQYCSRHTKSNQIHILFVTPNSSSFSKDHKPEKIREKNYELHAAIKYPPAACKMGIDSLMSYQRLSVTP
jgi:hypothetical protein